MSKLTLIRMQFIKFIIQKLFQILQQDEKKVLHKRQIN